jgi:hypothetical protein
MRARIAAAAIMLAGAGSVATLTLGTGAASASSYHAVKTMTLTGNYADGTSAFVGKNENDPTIGDEFIDSGPIRLGGKIVGYLTNACTIVEGTSEANAVTQCSGAIRLAKGEITTFGAEDSSSDTTDAITGGTGIYAYIRGSVETKSGADAATLIVRYITEN